MDIVCSICKKKFTAKKNLMKHLRDVHKNYKEANDMLVKKIRCPERNCDYVFRMMKELRNHIENFHEVKLLKDILQFPNDSVFQKWKKEEESNTVSWFVTNRKKTTLNNGQKKQIFYCHRTGQYNPKGFGKYRIKTKGSCKIGVTCPAAMEVVEFLDGQLTVSYCKTHLGHQQDVAHLKLSKEDKKHLAEKIELGFTFDSILEDVKEDLSNNSLKRKRIHLVSKKDLYRIMKSVADSPTKRFKTELPNTSSTNGSNHLLNSSTGCEVAKAEKLENTAPYSEQDVIFPPNCKIQKYTTIPQRSCNNGQPQILILSRDIDSMSEIIFLSTNYDIESLPTVATEKQTYIVEDSNVQKTEDSSQKLTITKYKLNKTNLMLKLKEKLNVLNELLPVSEFLTPKQFNLINTKLDAIMDLFRTADNKAKLKARKNNNNKEKR